MFSMKKRSRVLGLVGAIATLGITSPVLAANQITLTIGSFKTQVSIAALERFAQTGDISGLPLEFPLVPSESREKLQKQLNRPVSIDPNSPLDSLEEGLLKFLLPNSTEAERKSALTLMAEKAEGKTAINVLKVLPGDTITPNNFIQSLNAYQVPRNPAQALPIRVSQESSPGQGDFDNNILGFIDAFSTTETAKDYYSYGKLLTHYNGSEPGLTANRSHLFLVNAADGLSLFVVHDKPNNGNGGSAKMRFDLTGDTASIKVIDDAPSDQVLMSNGGTVFTSSHAWDPCCTDGLVIGSLENAWEMLVNFTAVSKGLQNGWYAYSSSTSSTIPLAMDVGKRLRLDIFLSSSELPTSVPEPSSILGLLTFSVFGATSLLKRKRQQKVLNSVVSD